jgi:hypothetical protein
LQEPSTFAINNNSISHDDGMAWHVMNQQDDVALFVKIMIHVIDLIN